jgi:hypothetical protein
MTNPESDLRNGGDHPEFGAISGRFQDDITVNPVIRTVFMGGKPQLAVSGTEFR